MSIVERVLNAVKESSSTEEIIQQIRGDMVVAEQSGDVRSVQQQRYAIRFLKRARRYSMGLLGDSDFLSALRDFILFVGRVQVPEHIQGLIRNRGTEFGLYLEAGNIADAQIMAGPRTIDAESFVRQVYGMEQTNLFPRSTSVGDAQLYRSTGFKRYRSFEQKVSVNTALRMPPGYSLLVSLPTGAGKSLVTQMLASVVSGLTVLIVPTVALGLDQYRAAKSILSHSLGADQILCHCGDVSPNQGKALVDSIEACHLRLLITSPEAIVRNERLRKSLDKAAEAGYLKYLVIDEAHIVQDWGALFRPDFQMLSVVRNDILKLSQGSVRTVLLSATLTETAIHSLKSLFSDGQQWIELRCDALRTEPRYLVEKCSNHDDLTKRIIHLCKTMPKPMILYEIKPEKAETWKMILNKEGFTNVVTFTGQTDDTARNRIVQDWSRDELDIVVATSAFGMGVDKPDVRSVIHATLPENINRFYQEVGRGGRDGLPSLSILCYCPFEDTSLRNYITSSRVLTVESMVDRWFSMLKADGVQFADNMVLLDTTTPPSHFTEIERRQRGSQNVRWNLNLLLFFIRYGYLDFVDMVYVATRNCYFVRVSMRDIELMRSPDALSMSLEPDREKEVHLVLSGYEAMKNVVKSPGQRCMAEYFTDLFRDAEPACGGCPNHAEAYSHTERYTFNHVVPLYGQLTQLNETQLLVTRHEEEPWDVTKAIELGKAFNSRGFSVLVLPSVEGADCSGFNGLVVDAEEFEHLVLKHSSLFLTNGIVCAFDDDTARNHTQYRALGKLTELGISCVYYCRQNMFIRDASRPIRHLVNADTLTYSEALR